METVEKTLKFLDNLAIEEDAIVALQDRMKRSKQRINDVLQLNEGNNFRRIIEYNITEEMFKEVYPNTYDYIMKKAQGNEFSITENWIKDPRKRKLSKFLGKIKSGLSIEERIDMRGLNEEIRNGDISVIFDIIKPKSIVISTNMYDFFTSASKSSFRSCYAIDGSHFNGNISYMTDNWTFMIYTYSDDIDRKIGRLWGYLLSTEQPMFLTSKIYGSMYETELGMAIFNISQSISPDVKWKVNELNYDNYGNASPRTEFPVPVYFDYDAITIHHTNGRLIPDNLPYLEFHNIKCMKCGTYTNNGYYGMCQECASDVIRCGQCNVVFHMDNIVHDTDVCQECYDKYYSECSRCGNKHLTNHLEEIDGEKICRYCLANTHRKCSLCNEYHLIEESTHIGSLWFCNVCKDMVYACSRCGRLVFAKDNDSRIEWEGMEICSICHSSMSGDSNMFAGKEFDFCYRQYYGRLNVQLSHNSRTVSYVFHCRDNYDEPRTFHGEIEFSTIEHRFPYVDFNNMNDSFREIVEWYAIEEIDAFNSHNTTNSPQPPEPVHIAFQGRTRNRFHIPIPEQPLYIGMDEAISYDLEDDGLVSYGTLNNSLRELEDRVDTILENYTQEETEREYAQHIVGVDIGTDVHLGVVEGTLVSSDGTGEYRAVRSPDYVHPNDYYTSIRPYGTGLHGIADYRRLYTQGNWDNTSVVREEYPF